MHRATRSWRVLVPAVAAFLILGIGTATADVGSGTLRTNAGKAVDTSGSFDFRDAQLGHSLTACPQAGLQPNGQPKPLDNNRSMDKVEQLSQGGDDRRANPEYSCFPQNEVSIDVNPTDPSNIMTSQNDYRLGFGSSGINSSTNNGNSFYSLIAPFPSLPSGDNLDGGGDPVSLFDRAGIAYYTDINFNRTDDTNGIWVRRSTNGGFTWTRPCVAIDNTPTNPTDDSARCGGAGDPRQPGDGTVIFNQDPTAGVLNGDAPFADKEYTAAGPRPAGVGPVCFGPNTRTPTMCNPDVVGVDRLYVTFTLFTATSAEIQFSFSDDQGRSWSRPRTISGSAPFCSFGAGNACDFNQFSVPTVNPVTGLLGIAFQNFNTNDENQYLFVRSRNGGTTFEGPFFITPTFDQNYPRSGSSRPDCSPRGQQGGRAVLTNTCFRVNSGGAVVADRRGGEFADDFYMVFSDNRNGTRVSSNVDVFMFTSKDGGSTWIGPTRVNNDPSRTPADRDCTRTTGTPPVVNPACAETFGNDQWFPWLDISEKGDLVVVFQDRRLDTESPIGVGEWPTSKTRQGNYISWFWGAQCSITTTATVTSTTTTIPRGASQCLAPNAAIVPQPTTGIDPDAGDLVGAGTSPFGNFVISDTGYNLDYSFRAGIFMGDYENVAIGPDNQAWAMWTDARNGRSSRNQPGRNPACEQSDVFVDSFSAASGKNTSGNRAEQGEELLYVTPCPTGNQDKGSGN